MSGSLVRPIEVRFRDSDRVALIPPTFPEYDAAKLDAVVYLRDDVTEVTFITVAEARERGIWDGLVTMR